MNGFDWKYQGLMFNVFYSIFRDVVLTKHKSSSCLPTKTLGQIVSDTPVD